MYNVQQQTCYVQRYNDKNLADDRLRRLWPGNPPFQKSGPYIKKFVYDKQMTLKI